MLTTRLMTTFLLIKAWLAPSAAVSAPNRP